MTPIHKDSITIIAEIAQGYEGSLEQARLLLRAASDSGANAAKIQVIYADEMSTPDYKHYQLFSSLEMSDKAWEELSGYAKHLGLLLYLDVFGERSLRLAEKVSTDALMIHATDINNLHLLHLVAKSKISMVLLNIGGAYDSEIKVAIDKLVDKKIVLMYGVQIYPTPQDDNHIRRILSLAEICGKNNSDITIGFADHTVPESNFHLALSSMALGAGARFFEKHITLGEVMKLEDYEAAINPDRFATYVKYLRDCFKAYGLTTKKDGFGMTDSEIKYREQVRRHVVTLSKIKAGSILKAENLLLKRTSSDKAITNFSDAINKVAQHDIEANRPVLMSELLPSEDTL